MYNLLIFGPPGVGKGTQAKLISERFGLFHLSTGEYLRKAIDEGTELGKKAKEIVEGGSLVPDNIMIGIVKEALIKNTTDKGFILDGFPRTIPQAEALSEIFNELNFKNIHVLHLTADEDELVRRLLNRGRGDDTEDTIKHRLHVYEDATKPVIEYYDGRTIIIDGIGEIEEINAIILEKLKDLG
ncbi:MAG: adenylate kinase [Ignavibacteriae bacterium]|nr:adenylate kinase [Ignavibacteriota bacterium]